ncbi:hypothetical protein A9261_15120 [Vibrio tasmaniensis]|nr:hypothetical protein A9261_15120 [Vibrio tasmaniensis]
MYKSVLIVDDIELSREVIKNAVSASGSMMRIELSSNAFAAINKIKKNSFDLVIMDIMMPNGDGFELLNMMSESNVMSKIFIISGLDRSIISSASMLGKLYGLDIVASLEKPIWAERLKSLVKATLTHDNDPVSKEEALVFGSEDNFPISLVYQPQVISDVNTIFGFEVMSRWADRDGTLLAPRSFLPIIEKMGKQKIFTTMLIKKFVKDYFLYFKGIGKSVRFSINITPCLLIEKDIVDLLLNMYLQGIDHKIVIELKEAFLPERIEKELLANILRLKLNGFDISIDGFGMSSVNIERIIRLPVSEIKMDKEITWGISHNIDYIKKVDKMMKLASSKNARVIFDGVESKDQSDFLEALGGFFQQGFYHGPPSSPEIILENTEISKSFSV